MLSAARACETWVGHGMGHRQAGSFNNFTYFGRGWPGIGFRQPGLIRSSLDGLHALYLLP